MRHLAAIGLAVLLSACSSPRPSPAPTRIGKLFDQSMERARGAVDVALRRPEQAVALRPPDAVGRSYAYCEEALRRHSIDVDAENAAALAAARAVVASRRAAYDVLLVPGYTPLDQAEPVPGVHPIARDRLDRAVADLRSGIAPLILVSGGNVHPEGTPYNEAIEMKRYLVGRGVPPDRVLIEPCARHSHTNLRNAGRLMESLGLGWALIVTSRDQTMYFAHPRTSSFDGRCLSDLGYVVGALDHVDDFHTSFLPSGNVFTRGRDALDP
ncbi:MAG: YdcF family protein [Minicystis sp.]